MATQEAVNASVLILFWHGLSRMSRLQCRLMDAITRPTTATSSPSWQARDLNEHLMQVGHRALEGGALWPERLLLSPRSVAGQDSTMSPPQMQQPGCICSTPERSGRHHRRQGLLRGNFT